MKLTIGHLIKGVAALGLCSIIMFSQTDPAQAILEGSNRERMEYLDFSEKIIKEGFYAKTGKATFNRDKKSFVRGVKRHNEPKIYQPDVYTWELAMKEHRKKTKAMVPAEKAPAVDKVTPVPMSQEGILPENPNGGMAEVYPGIDNKAKPVARDLKAEDIKRRIIEHMNSLDNREAQVIPALQPALPMPQAAQMPAGTKGDSCDASF